jgi:hypothetical protein
LRRAVLLRDQHRCQVPGCNNVTWLDIHHVELRSEGGRHTMENLICVCAGITALPIAARSPSIETKLVLCASDMPTAAEYGRSVKPQALEVRAKVFSALRNLGFREAQVRAALEQLQREPTLAQASFDGLLREALAHLHLSAGGVDLLRRPELLSRTLLARANASTPLRPHFVRSAEPDSLVRG